MKGIDVSNNNGAIDFNKVKNSGVEVVYIKATEGISFTDAYLKTNYDKAKAVGLKVGFYHFLRKNNPVAEAKYFLQATSGLEADCIYICDIEGGNWDVSQASNAVRQFADYLLGQGKQVGIYTGDYFYRDNLNSTVNDLPLWVANYGASKPMASNYAGWQYSEKGQVPGISTNVDINEFREDILIQEVKKVENIVVYNYGPDQGAAEYLANYLNCPVITNSRKFDFSCVKNVYAVGGKKEQYSSYVKQVISGTDQYETMKEVLHFCGKLW